MWSKDRTVIFYVYAQDEDEAVAKAGARLVKEGVRNDGRFKVWKLF